VKDDEEFRDCAGCVCAGIRRAARVVTRHYQRHMRDTGLRGTQFPILVALINDGPLPVGRLAKRLGVERTTLTRNLAPLVKNQWIRILSEEDGRVHFVTITAKGKSMARSALPAWRAAQASVGPKLKEFRFAQLFATAG
jgi:DNA-binding MarR family transcriptional regulator